MQTAVLRGIHKVKRTLADGSVRTYFYAWRGGPRMEAEPGSEEFWLEFAEHKRTATAKRVKTLGDLIDDFTGPEDARTVAFRQLARSTQTDYLYAYRLAKKEWPDLPVSLTQQRGARRKIETWLDKFADNPRKRDKLLFALSKVFSHAVAGEEIDKNPCSGIKRLYQGSRREAIWSREQIAAYRATAPAHMLLAFEMAIGTAQRQGDLLAATWKQYDGAYLRFELGKSRRGDGPGKRLRVKVHARLKKLLDAQPQDTIRILTNSRGRPWTNGGFQASWKKSLRKAKVNGVTFHDLRGTFITERRREGSSIEDIALISGHSIGEVKSVLERHYLADDQDASDAVILRMEGAMR